MEIKDLHGVGDAYRVVSKLVSDIGFLRLDVIL